MLSQTLHSGSLVFEGVRAYETPRTPTDRRIPRISTQRQTLPRFVAGVRPTDAFLVFRRKRRLLLRFVAEYGRASREKGTVFAQYPSFDEDALR